VSFKRLTRPPRDGNRTIENEYGRKGPLQLRMMFD
jgi:hypothetical protein